MKIFKRVILVITFIIIVVCAAFGISGYKMYKNALNEMPLADKVASIRQKENYADIDEIPQMYKDAVISVEDHRFYKHNGIDIIAIGRAVVNDIKAMDFVEGGSTIYFGDGYYTIREASLGYLGKEPKDMTDSECILLAGIPNAPSVYSPTKNPELTKQSQRQVMEKMIENKLLTKDEAKEIFTYS